MPGTLGTGSENRDLLILSKLPQRIRTGIEGRSIKEQDTGSKGKGTDKPIPHHPAAGRVVEDGVVPLHVSMELEILKVLQQSSAHSMDDTLGNPCGAGGIHDVERMITQAPARR